MCDCGFDATMRGGQLIPPHVTILSLKLITLLNAGVSLLFGSWIGGGCHGIASTNRPKHHQSLHEKGLLRRCQPGRWETQAFFKSLLLAGQGVRFLKTKGRGEKVISVQ